MSDAERKPRLSSNATIAELALGCGAWVFVDLGRFVLSWFA